MSATLVIFGLFDGAQMAGQTAIAREDARTATLAMSYLRAPWRGRGLAAMLYGARLDWARANGIRRVIVSHRASNVASARAVRAHGFRRTGAAPHRWPDGAVDDDVRYVLGLA